MAAETGLTLKEIIDSSPANQKCMDCGMARPQWASITYGIFICLNCAGVHRSFGVKVSVVKSVGMDMWPLADITRMEKGGNERFGAYIAQYKLSSLPKPQLYSEKRVQEYAKQLEKEVALLHPAEKPAAPKAAQPGKESPRSVDGPAPRQLTSTPLSASYTTSYPITGQSLGAIPSIEAIQSSLTDMLGKAAGYFYTGASALSEKVILPASSVIKEKGSQLTDYLKGKDKKKDQPASPGRPRPSAPKKAGAYPKRDAADKWD